jgi:hypothetical protein
MSNEELSLFIDCFEKDPRVLFRILRKEAGIKLTMIMTGRRKIRGSKLLPNEVVRIQYAYCAYMILSRENGHKFARGWLLRGNMYLRDPALAIRSYPSNKLFLVMNAVINCVKSSRGVIP